MHKQYLIASASAVALLAAMPGAHAASSDSSQIAILKRQIQAQQQQLQQQSQSLQQQQQLLDNLIANEQQTKAQLSKVAPAAKPSAVVVMSRSNSPGWRSADGRNEIDLGALLQVDFGTAGYRPEFKSGAGTTASYQKMTSGWNARRAQIQVTGTFQEDFHFALQYDFGGSNEAIGGSSTSSGVQSGIKTALFTYTGFKPWQTNLSLEFGYTSPPVTIDSAIPSNAGLFIEHPTPDRMQTFEAGPGIPTLGFRSFNNRYFLYYAFAGTRSGGEHDQGANVQAGNGSTGSQTLAAIGRLSYLVLNQSNLKLQLGGGFERTLQPGSSATFSDNAEDRVDQTNIIGVTSASTALNPVTAQGDYTFELAGEYGPVFVSGAYIHYDIERKGLKENDFWGGYGNILYSITGEKHPYLASSGGWGNLSPAHPVSLKDHGFGAWEIGARLSYVNLNSNPVPFSAAALPTGAGAPDLDGGHVYQTDLGLNWYISDNLRAQLNWIHGVQGGLPGTARGGFTNVTFYSPTLQNGNKATLYNAHWDEVAVRMQFSF